MSKPRILVAGIGNIFLGDDAFGVEVVGRLARRPLSEDVRVIDFGIRGLDLTYALLDDAEIVILVDALSRGEPPGTLYVLEPEREVGEPGAEELMIDPHALAPGKVLRLAAALGSPVQRVLLVGCEPASTGEAMGLSPPVAAAVEEAIPLVEGLVARLREELITLPEQGARRG